MKKPTSNDILVVDLIRKWKAIAACKRNYSKGFPWKDKKKVVAVAKAFEECALDLEHTYKA